MRPCDQAPQAIQGSFYQSYSRSHAIKLFLAKLHIFCSHNSTVFPVPMSINGNPLFPAWGDKLRFVSIVELKFVPSVVIVFRVASITTSEYRTRSWLMAFYAPGRSPTGMQARGSISYFFPFFFKLFTAFALILSPLHSFRRHPT